VPVRCRTPPIAQEHHCGDMMQPFSSLMTIQMFED